MTKKFIRIIACILIALTVIEILPMSVIAQEVLTNDTKIKQTDKISSETDNSDSEIIGEDESLRTENEKYFRREDGSYVAAVYGGPVHYRENGKWEEIDNTLNAVKDKSGDITAYKTEKTATPVSFPETMADGKKITLSGQGYNVDFSMIGNEKSVSENNAVVSNPGETENQKQAVKKSASILTTEEQNNEKTKVQNINSSIKYEDVLPETDLEYVVTSSKLKESIIVNERQTSYTYSFLMNFDGLIPVSQKDGSIYLMKSLKDKEPVFVIDAPYMFDAKEAESKAVKMSLEKSGDHYILNLVADSAWINDEERAFPVTIDPTLLLTFNYLDIIDNYVDTSYPGENNISGDYIYAGMNSLGRTRTYIKFNLPSLPDCSIVTDAQLNLIKKDYSSTGGTSFINVYDCESRTWNNNTLTWNNQPFSTSVNGYTSATVLDYLSYSASAFSFDITKAAKRWYEQNVNNGVMLASSDETVDNRIRFYASDWDLGSNPENYYPTMTISYVNNTGIEDYWTYENVDLGRSGTAYVNDYNGGMTYIHNDISLSGSRMPLNFSHYYTSDSTYSSGTYGDMRFGVGFRLDILEQIIAVTSSDNTNFSDYPYKLLDGDGTIHYYKKKVENGVTTYYDEYDESIVMVKNANNSFTITDGQGNVKQYSTGGYLLSTQDSNGNTQTINYNTARNRILSVTDGAGRSATFTYDSLSRLTAITDPSGRNTTYTYASDTSYYLRSINYPDGTSTTFYYSSTSGSKISQIVANDTSDVLFNYKTVVCNVNKTFYRVSSYERRGKVVSGSRTTENLYTLTYREGETKIEDNFSKVNYLMFDNAGRTVANRDEAANAEYSTYNSSGNKANTISKSSDVQSVVSNLAKNHSAELTDSTWYKNGDGTGSIALTTAQHYIGAKAFQVTSTAATGRVTCCQYFTGTPGKTYTLSAYIKIPTTLTVNSGVSGGACVGIGYESSNGTWLLVKGEYVKSSTEWDRYYVTFTLPSDCAGGMGLYLSIVNATGTAYFDAVQMEEGYNPNRYQLLENNTFDRYTSNTFDGWTLQNHNSSTDGVVTNWSGKGVKFVGSQTADKRVRQQVRVDAKAGDTLVYGGWAQAKASGGANANGRSFGISLTLSYSDGTYGYYSVKFQNDVVQFQYLTGSVTFEKDCTSITYYMCYYDEVNSVIFDNAEMYIDSYGSNYTYDNDGNLTAMTDSDGNGTGFDYDTNDNLTDISTVKEDGTTQTLLTAGYDAKHNVTSSTENGVTTEYTYDTYGNMTEKKIKKADGTNQMEEYYEYSSTYNYAYLENTLDENGGLTLYSYNFNKGLLNYMVTPRDNMIYFKYDANNDQLRCTSKNWNESLPINSYGYTYDMLTSIAHNGFSYGFNYDSLNRLTSTQVGSQTISSNTYNANGTLATTTYGNGTTYSATYDSLDRVASESYNGTRTYGYSYNKSGNLARETDYENGSKVWWYDYDSSSNLRSIKSSDGKSIKYGFDGSGNKTTVTESDNGTLLSSAAYSYTNDNRVSSINLTSMHNGTLNYSYEDMNRLSKKSHTVTSWTPTTKVNTTYSYQSYSTANIAQILFQKVDSSSGSDVVTATHGKLNYTYDWSGNIVSIRENDVLKVSYNYDEYDQLMREDNAWLNKSIEYTYDGFGNILSKIEYAYTTGTLGTPTKTINYTYGDTNWKDKMTAYDGKAITYDAIGNPLTYDGYTYTWQKGRELATISGNGTNLTFKYNSSGLRTQKISGSTTTEYVYVDDRLMSQSNGTDTLSFIYDTDGQAIGVNRNGYYYYYLRNVQGDVIALYNCYGDINSRYTYDSWGNLIAVTDANGTAITDPTHIANVNPIRYRGYYYDTETGLYYLQSRYYNPQWGRFINADDMGVLSLSKENVLGTNLFAYCENNPVNDSDPSGYLGKHWWNSVKWVGRIIDAAIIVITAGKSYASFKALKAFLKANKNRVVHQVTGKLVKMFGYSIKKYIPIAFNLAATIFGTSIGDIIARALDYADKWFGHKRNNGYILN